MLRAFALARRSLPPATLVIAGVTPGKWTPLCRELGILEHVRLVPKTNNVADYLQIMSLLAFPSSFIESQPNVIMEGMAMGLPVIGSNIGGIGELLPGECLFDPGDTTAFSSLLIRLLDNPAEMAALGEANHAKRHLFSLENRLDTVMGLYRKALSELRPKRATLASPAR
jgi:Glycosyltransferase